MEVQRASDIVSRNDNVFIIDLDEVSYDIWFDAFGGPIDVDNVSTRIVYEFSCIIDVYWDYDLFTQWSLCSYIDVWLGFAVTTDEFLYLFNFFCSENSGKLP